MKAGTICISCQRGFSVVGLGLLEKRGGMGFSHIFLCRGGLSAVSRRRDHHRAPVWKRSPLLGLHRWCLVQMSKSEYLGLESPPSSSSLGSRLGSPSLPPLGGGGPVARPPSREAVPRQGTKRSSPDGEASRDPHRPRSKRQEVEPSVGGAWAAFYSSTCRQSAVGGPCVSVCHGLLRGRQAPRQLRKRATGHAT